MLVSTSGSGRRRGLSCSHMTAGESPRSQPFSPVCTRNATAGPQGGLLPPAWARAPPRQSWGSRGSASPASAAAEVESRALGSRTNRPDPGSDHARPGLPDSCSSVLWPVWGWGCSTVTVTVTGGAQPSPWRHRAASSTRGPQLQTPSPNSSVLAPAGVRWPWAWRLPPTPRQPASTLPHQPGAQGQPGDPVTFQKCPVHHHHPLGFSGSQHEPAWPSPDSGPHPFQLPTATQAREEPGSRGKSRLTEVGL